MSTLPEHFPDARGVLEQCRHLLAASGVLLLFDYSGGSVNVDRGYEAARAYMRVRRCAEWLEPLRAGGFADVVPCLSSRKLVPCAARAILPRAIYHSYIDCVEGSIVVAGRKAGRVPVE